MKAVEMLPAIVFITKKGDAVLYGRDEQASLILLQALYTDFDYVMDI